MLLFVQMIQLSGNSAIAGTRFRCFSLRIPPSLIRNIESLNLDVWYLMIDSTDTNTSHTDQCKGATEYPEYTTKLKEKKIR